MKLIPLIFALLIVLCQLTPVIAVNTKEVTVEETTKLKVKEASKEKVTVKEFTSTASGDSKVKSKDIELKTEKLDKCLKISSTSKTKSKLVDSHDILVPVADIQNFNGHSVRITHFTDDGIQDNEYIQKVIVQDGYVLIQDVEFSSVIVDGATGISSTTYTSYNVTDNSFIASHTADRMVIETVGVADGVEIDENDSSTYPQSQNIVKLFTGYSDGEYIDVGDVLYESGSAYVSSSAYITHDDVVFSDASSHTIFTRQKWNSSVSVPTFVIPFGAHNYRASSIYYKTSSNNSTFRNTYSESVVVSGSDSASLFDGENHTTCLIVDNDSVYFNIDAVQNGIPTAVNSSAVKYSGVGRGYPSNTYNWVGWIDTYVLYNISLVDSDIRRLYTGYSGTSISPSTTSTWTHIQNNTATIYNVSEDDVFNVLTPTETTASEFTVTYYYTEDTTLEYETEADGVVSFAINFTPSQNYSSTLLNWTPSTNNFTHNLSFTSTDPNATAITHNQIVRITTGALLADVNYWFNGTLSSLESFNYTRNIISKTPTKVVIEYNSTNSNVENDFYLENMSASSTFDFKYSNGTILTNATSDSNGYLKFDDVGGVTDSYKLINDTYTIEKQSSTVSFVAVVFTGLSFVGLHFANRFRRR